jgi:aarF domain-containing kinase
MHYADLWRAMIFGEPDAIKLNAELLGAGDLYPLFASVLTRKPWDEIQQPLTDSERLASKYDSTLPDHTKAVIC